MQATTDLPALLTGLWEAKGNKVACVGFKPGLTVKLLKRGVGAMPHLPQQPSPSFRCLHSRLWGPKAFYSLKE